MLMALRALAAVGCLMMVAAAAVQYNDPDGPLWMLYYLVPGFWAGVLAWRPTWACETPWRTRALWASLVFSLALMIFYWPPMPNFWRKEVWWVEEEAREGMGLMIAFAVAVLAGALHELARRGALPAQAARA